MNIIVENRCQSGTCLWINPSKVMSVFQVTNGQKLFAENRQLLSLQKYLNKEYPGHASQTVSFRCA